MPYVRRVRFRGVRQLHSTAEADPKDSGQLSAESVEGRGLTKENVEQLLLDRTQRRASRSRGLLGVRAAARLRRAGWSSSSKVRAVCGSAARTDLCGGRSAMTVPTAIGLVWKTRRLQSSPPSVR